MAQKQKNLSKNQIHNEKRDIKSKIKQEQSISKDIARFGVGFDVHKNKIDTCVSAQLVTGNIIQIKYHTFRANPKGIEELLHFLRKYTPVSCYLMECTGVYLLPPYHSLKGAFPEQSHKIIAMNPLLLHRRIDDLGKHSDKANAQNLSALTFYTTLLRPSYIGTMHFFRLRDMIRSYHKSQQNVTRFKNRITRVLHSINIKDAFDLRNEWSLLLLDRYISKSWNLGEAYEALILERKQNNQGTAVIERHYSALKPYLELQITDKDRFMVQMELSRMLQEQIIALTFLRNAENYVIDDPFYVENYKKLCLIPGMGPLSSLTVLLEIGDYTRFKNANAFAKFCGTAPKIYESGEQVHHSRLNRHSNKYVRTSLMTASGIILNKTKRGTDLGEYAYKQYHVRNLPYKKAMLKVSNKLSKAIYYILVENIDYDPLFEQRSKKEKSNERLLERKHSLLHNSQTRALRRDINDFIASNFEFLNSSSRFLLVSGFKKMIKKAEDISKVKATELEREKNKP